jgi:AcrR family transcriptional regulator
MASAAALRLDRPADASSREKLLNAAERLFADHGFNGVSVRQIAAAAGVNSALVGYYFGSKTGLLSQVYRLHCEPMNRERARLLEHACRGSAPSLEAIIEAFVRPALAVSSGNAGLTGFTRLRAVLSAENSELLETLVAENFDRSSTAFIDALRAALPELPPDEVYWRFHFLLGAVYYTATGPHRVRALSQGRCDPSDSEMAIAELVRFVAAGFRAPASPVEWSGASLAAAGN